MSVALLAPYGGDVKVLSQVATREAVARLLPFAAPDAIALSREASQYLDNPTGKEAGVTAAESAPRSTAVMHWFNTGFYKDFGRGSLYR